MDVEEEEEDESRQRHRQRQSQGLRATDRETVEGSHCTARERTRRRGKEGFGARVRADGARTASMADEDYSRASDEADREMTRLWRTWRTVFELLLDRVRLDSVLKSCLFSAAVYTARDERLLTG